MLVRSKVISWKLARTLLLAVLFCLPAAAPAAAQEGEWAQYNKDGTKALAERRYKDAEQLLDRSVKAAEKLGKEDLRLAEILTNLSAACYGQKKYQQAVLALRRALRIREKALGAEHLDVAATLENLADAYPAYEMTHGVVVTMVTVEAIVDLSRPPLGSITPLSVSSSRVMPSGISFPETEAALKRAMAIREKVLPAAHPDRIRTMAKLARLYVMQSKLKEAEPLYERLAAINEQAFGSGHLEYAASAKELAGVYFLERKYAESEKYFRSALFVLENTPAAEPLELAGCLFNLAEVYHTQRKYPKAETHYQRALAVLEKKLGPDDLNVRWVLLSYAELLRSAGRKDEARALEARAEKILQKHQEQKLAK